ncbi:Digestive cysteine proteinase 2 [Durusdinium trenchii]|uniref:Digestive cysteine proteinase 2 n=1 Tax=Durusdinium trenchii TaxID=1381693 RepID=A0ABP0NCW1_9DINO
MTEIRGTGGMISQAEEGMKLFEAQQGSAAEVDTAGAEKYKTEVEARIQALEAEANLLTGKDNKKERAAKGKEVAELKAEQTLGLRFG